MPGSVKRRVRLRSGRQPRDADPMSTLAIERRAADEADVAFLLELRRRTMTRHQIASGVIPSDEEHRRRVLARYECAQILSFGGRPMGLLKVEREGLEWVLHQIQIEPEFQGRGRRAALNNDALYGVGPGA
jgi:hypothetical protein